jgi:uncharacterized membrane protein YfhO
MTRWDPEDRSFRLDSPHGGRFVLAEQFFPGWEVLIDGSRTVPERADGTFQSATIPGGQHTVHFRYRPWSVRAGAVVSALCLIAVVAIALPRRHILEGNDV